MCTLTFVPRSRGYYLAMNRDERYSRGQATRPHLEDLGGVRAIFPRDIAGGTWIAVTDLGTSWALQNWHVPYDYEKTVSRGLVIPRVASCLSAEQVERTLIPTHLAGMPPFRLFGFLPKERAIREWRWDGSQVGALSFGWRLRQWYSSGLSDEKAAAARAAIFRTAQRRPSAGSIAWLRSLHRSHRPAGPFSICVHGDVAGTLSYTEIVVSPAQVSMRYADRRPCETPSGALQRSELVLDGQTSIAG